MIVLSNPLTYFGTYEMHSDARPPSPWIKEDTGQEVKNLNVWNSFPPPTSFPQKRVNRHYHICTDKSWSLKKELLLPRLTVIIAPLPHHYFQRQQLVLRHFYQTKKANPIKKEINIILDPWKDEKYRTAAWDTPFVNWQPGRIPEHPYHIILVLHNLVY